MKQKCQRVKVITAFSPLKKVKKPGGIPQVTGKPDNWLRVVWPSIILLTRCYGLSYREANRREFEQTHFSSQSQVSLASYKHTLSLSDFTLEKVSLDYKDKIHIIYYVKIIFAKIQTESRLLLNKFRNREQ